MSSIYKIFISLFELNRSLNNQLKVRNRKHTFSVKYEHARKGACIV